MDEMASLWSYQETMDELKQKLLYSSIELEQLKAESGEEKRKNREYVKQLLQLLKVACKERDEARDQLQKLLGKKSYVPKANSGITESNSLSGSSPAVSSPEFLNNAVDSVQNNLVPRIESTLDQVALAMPLPQKGKLLQAVLEAGPLLQTLLVAGPLPRWRNPPQLKPFHIPPVSIPLPAASSRPLLSQMCFDFPGAESSQMPSTPLLNSGGFNPGSCFQSQWLMSAGLDSANGYSHLEKRQRLQ